VFDRDGRLKHERGVTASPGVYLLGLPWLHTRGSALLGWVKDDAMHLADRIAALAARPLDGRAGRPLGVRVGDRSRRGVGGADTALDSKLPHLLRTAGLVAATSPTIVSAWRGAPDPATHREAANDGEQRPLDRPRRHDMKERTLPRKI
jgi:hypothetical protein